MKIPGPDHPIVIEPFSGSVGVMFNNVEIACSEPALALNERPLSNGILPSA